MLNFGSSGALQQQIEQGAPVDIFISAAPKQMDALQQKNFLMEGSRHDLLENRMVLIVPRDSTAINSFQDLARERVKKVAIGAPESVPAGKYAQEAIVSLGLWEQILSKVVYAKDVRQVLAYVETGNVDAGIVYQTDTKISDKVKVIAAAASQSHSPVLYPMAVIKGSKHSREAVEFTNFLTGEKAKKIFEKYGFIVVAK
ncbi:MAG: molybdenum transporter, periplasmic molybdate-binding protein [Peptococcaceae bacterium]|nr:molybdenum transporter, periplasmic molybdate-binding protein [Peptococcaceae bacterium]